MLTYQDFMDIYTGEPITGSGIKTYEDSIMEFVMEVINEHKGSELYQTAYEADCYNRKRNKTIMDYQKMLYTLTGKLIPDAYSANHKMTSAFFNRFITQENQYLLGNGITWTNEATKKALGDDFEQKLQKAGEAALWGGVSFVFWNVDHMNVFTALEYAPIYDEENGAMRAGVQFWQIDDTKPLRATLYTEDGYTEFIWRRDGDDARGEVLAPTRPYIQTIETTEAGLYETYDGENYPSFPIVPLWANNNKQSELVGIQEQIDCYDLIKSGYANNVDDGSIIYWVVKNAGGMDDVDLAKFVERIKTVHAVEMDIDQTAEPKTIEPPYQSREALLEKLEKDLYKDAMALNTETIASGAVTATQIKAAYEPLNSKVDQYEHCIKECLKDVLELAGIDDTPTFTRSMLVNATEEIQAVLQASPYLSDEYVTKKLLTLLGDSDQAEDILKQMDADEIDRLNYEEPIEEEQTEETQEEEVPVEE